MAKKVVTKSGENAWLQYLIITTTK